MTCFKSTPREQSQCADNDELDRRREGAGSLVIYCTSNAGRHHNRILAGTTHSYVGMSSTATNVRALRLSVARRH